MGLGIFIKGTLKAGNKKTSGLTAVEEYIIGRSEGIFRDFLALGYNDEALSITLHPAEEPVQFEWSGDIIKCSARTNSVGPGYHAYVVELLEDLGNALGIEWSSDLGEGDEYFEDETGYYGDRNFARLQVEMLRWLRSVCRIYDEQGGDRIMISLPAGSPSMKRDYFAVSAVGVWEREWFVKVRNTEPEDLQWAGEEFFIWWNKEPDALFYKQTGIALLNVDCPWHYPEDENERKLLETIDQCFITARNLDPSIELPEEDWTAIRKLLEEDADIPDTAYGYRKHPMTFRLPGNWSIDLPGSMYEQIDDGTLVHYDETRTVRSTAYTTEKSETDAEFADAFFENNERLHDAGTEVIHSDDSAVCGKALIYYNIDKEEESEYWILQGVKVKRDHFLLSTICYTSDDEKDWAVEAWNSISLVGRV